ncbi:hypothetical protein S2L_35 [Cyanophage S-2L]|nr:hypothetical protein S2L_35 [Cyanophage S-2L]
MALASFIQTTDLSAATQGLVIRHLQTAISCLTRTEMPKSATEVQQALAGAGYDATTEEAAELWTAAATAQVPLASNRTRKALYRAVAVLPVA